MPRDKSRYRDKRSSSYSSEDSYERKKSRSKHKRRSRSRDRSEYSESSSHRRKRSTSRSRHKRRSYTRSASRERYDKSRRRSSSRSRSKRDRSHSRSSSRSRSKTKYSKSKKSHKRRSSSSRSSSLDIERAVPARRVNIDDTESKVEKAIKAAEAAGLTMTKIPTYEYKEVEIKEDMPTIHDRNLLAELNNDSFVQRSFTSSRNKKESTTSIVIDLNAQTVKVPESEIKAQDDSIVNFDEIPNEEELKEMWIKKLYQYRKRMLKGEI